ncbi:MAG: hypothetical protein ACFFAU_01195 [Candidatus Hodarchaeota archaeon]
MDAPALRYRVGIILKNGKAIAKNVSTTEEAETFVLEVAEKQGVKYYRVMDRNTREIVSKGDF